MPILSGFKICSPTPPLETAPAPASPSSSSDDLSPRTSRRPESVTRAENPARARRESQYNPVIPHSPPAWYRPLHESEKIARESAPRPPGSGLPEKCAGYTQAANQACIPAPWKVQRRKTAALPAEKFPYSAGQIELPHKRRHPSALHTSAPCRARDPPWRLSNRDRPQAP